MTWQEIAQLDEAYFMRTFGARQGVAFTRGEGAVLYDETGKGYVDFLGGIAVNCLGHNYGPFADAVCAQVRKVIHTSSLYYIEAQAKLAQQIATHTCADRVFFANSGAEANEGAIKLVRKYFYEKGQDRYEIITVSDSFHGRTLATIAATAQSKYQKPFRPMPAGFLHVANNDIEALKSAIGPHTAAILLETIQGEGGVIEASSAYLQAVRALCDEHGLLLVFDEVQTGMGRTGKLMSYEHFGVEPDIFTLAKALGAGIPIGAVCAKAHCCAFAPGDHGSTFGGNPLSCTAGLAVFEALYGGGLLARCAQTGAYFKAQLSALQERHRCITDVRGKGLLLGAQLDASVNGASVVAQLLPRGFLINCAGHNTLRFAPPYVIATEQIDALIHALDDAL